MSIFAPRSDEKMPASPFCVDFSLAAYAPLRRRDRQPVLLSAEDYTRVSRHLGRIASKTGMSAIAGGVLA
ncbi:MAG: hypothetical protein KKB50_14960 [Planctomycetes bacterium]|nr:hypothetical protein [Planctomycetota bacterium]